MRAVSAGLIAFASGAMLLSGSTAAHGPLYSPMPRSITSAKRGPSRHAHSIATRKQRAAARKRNRGARK